MKKYIYIPFLLALLCCKDKSSDINNTNFIKTFEGTIGEKYEAILKIRVDGGNVEGNYFYRKSGKKINVKGAIDASGNLNLDEYDANGNQTGLFKGKLIGNSKLSGVWSKPDGSKQMNFNLLESNADFEILAKNDEQKANERGGASTQIESSQASKKYTKSDLFGNWWTPHYAVRKIKFNIDNTFVFEDGKGNIFKGSYEFDGVMVHIVFKNKLDKYLKMSGGEEHSYVLSGDGENFVKEWEESH